MISVSCFCLFGLDIVSCKSTVLGLEYRGTLSYTKSGHKCQHWVAQSPHEHNMTDPSKFPEETIAEAQNFCRNPNNHTEGPWCYTMEPKVEWETCDIAFCKRLLNIY